MLLLAAIPAGISDAVPDSDRAQERQDFLEQYRPDDSVRQVLIISHTEGSSAKAEFFVRNEAGDWELRFADEALTGKNGMGKEKEGDLKTPYGDFGVTGAFGILPDPGTELPFLPITETTYACDEEGPYYNRIIDTKETGHACRGEKMIEYPEAYAYGITFDFNPENRYPDGSDVFLHCFGRNPYTAGCVALSEENMREILLCAEPGMRIRIDEY